MNPHDDAPLSGNERLDDALLQEHARAGTGADDAFLTQLETTLDADSTWIPRMNTVKDSRSSGLNFRSLAKIAAVILVGAMLWGLTAPMVIRQRKGGPSSIQTMPLRESLVVSPASFIGTSAIPEEDPANSERYGQLIDNPWQTPLEAPLSTFSTDVDTASYTNLRRMIRDGARIPSDAVRLEEMVNYFDYSHAPPTGEHPFAVHVANAACPWNPDHQLVRVALKGREIARTERAPANLVFLLDVSGSMNEPRKLPLMTQAFQFLLEELNASDTLSIVVYAGSEGLALSPTACDAAGRQRVETALRNLRAGGSTNGGAGIKLAYQLAREHFKPGGINRVILATDGDFNVGVTGNGGLVRLVEQNAKSKVFLTVLGFGTGNLNDGMLEAITNKGDGTYHYIDSQKEARNVFLRKLMGTLVTIAKDVKIQVEFNPGKVRRYRLLGYANRMLRKEDFANDRIDAGDIGSGHTVTAFYEVETGNAHKTPPAGKLRYQQQNPKVETEVIDPDLPVNPEWLTVKLRYKQPEGDRSTLMENPFVGTPQALEDADSDFRFGSAVAMAGLLLRQTEGTEGRRFHDVIRIANGSLGVDPHGQRHEFLGLMQRLSTRENHSPGGR